MLGNAVNVQVSCCNQKAFIFSSATEYSQPDSETDGPLGGPTLMPSYTYIPNTSGLYTSTDVDGNTTSYTYDSDWRLSGITYPPASGATRSITYASSQLLITDQTTYQDNDGITKTPTNLTVLDGAGRVLAAGSGASTASGTSFDAVATSYDQLGRVSQQSNPYPTTDLVGLSGSAPTTTCTLDGDDRVTQVQLPDGQLVKSAYSNTGAANTRVITDEVGRQQEAVFDGLGRMKAAVEQDTEFGLLDVATSYSYDALNNLTGVNHGGQTRTYLHDGLSRVMSVTTPEAGTVTYTYYDFNAVNTRLDARGVKITYAYDGLNRLTGITYPSGGALPAGVAPTTNVTIGYSTVSGQGNGQVNSVTDGAGTESYLFDTLGRVLSKTRNPDAPNSFVNSYKTSYSYNPINQLSTITYPSLDVFRNDYDSRGRVVGVDKMSGTSVSTGYIQKGSVQYNSAQQVLTQKLGNGVVEGYTYDGNRLQLTGQTAEIGSTYLMNLTYNYQIAAGNSGANTAGGDSGQLGAVTATIAQPAPAPSQGRNQTFAYDNVGRLTTATGWGEWGRLYSYDQKGNRTGTFDTLNNNAPLQTVSIAQTSPGSGVPNNRVNTVTSTANGVPNTVTYSYDFSGNLTNDGAHNYMYDAEGRLAQVDPGTTNEFDYSYDVNNWRVKKVPGSRNLSGATTYYAWNGGQVIAEYSNAPASAVASVMYYYRDQLSTRLVTDSNATVLGTEDTLPYGDDPGPPLTGTGGAGQTDPFRFTNYQRDSESGTDYAVNRQDSNALGRLMQPDRENGSVANPQSLNRYAYALNDPINVVDPLGLDSTAGTPSTPYIPGFGNGPGWSLDVPAGDEGQITYSGVIPPGTMQHGLLLASAPGATGGSRRPGVNLDVLKMCIQQVTGFTTMDFTLATPGQDGSFIGLGPDSLVNGGNNRMVEVVSDDTTFTKLAMNGGQLPPPPARPAVGFEDPDDPYVDYIASDQSAWMIVATQVHELGNSLADIAGVKNPIPGSKADDPDVGQKLEECVKRNKGFNFNDTSID
jgi:RHS repeat-associated protein